MNIDPPCVSIDPPQSPYTVGIGDRLILHCYACGLPLPKVQWYTNNTPINQQPPEFILVSTKEAGTTEYTCVASNNAGNMTHTVRNSITIIVQSM